MRLTEKINNYYFSKDKIQGDHNKEINKLGQLEDIEEELDIDLIIGGKALINGIYTKQFGYISGDSLAIEKYRICIPSKSMSLPFVGRVGYGKTWALTKEELL